MGNYYSDEVIPGYSLADLDALHWVAGIGREWAESDRRAELAEHLTTTEETR